jgi:hypothetical protein
MNVLANKNLYLGFVILISTDICQPRKGRWERVDDWMTRLLCTSLHQHLVSVILVSRLRSKFEGRSAIQASDRCGFGMFWYGCDFAEVVTA